MKNLVPIYQKELRSYFVSPVAYVVIAVFLVLSGYFFYAITGYYNYLSQQWQSRPYFGLNPHDGLFRPLLHNFSVVMLLVLPLLTMRLFAEEKKSGTIELLFTYPLKDAEIILGKFFAALTVFKVMLALTLIQPLIISFYLKLAWWPLITGYFGLILLGTSFLAMGIFISSMTENQIIAAIVSFGTLLIFWVIGWAAQFAGWAISKVLTELSIIDHCEEFTKGIVNSKDIIFYLLFTFFFLFLTYSVLGTKKWRG